MMRTKGARRTIAGLAVLAAVAVTTVVVWRWGRLPRLGRENVRVLPPETHATLPCPSEMALAGEGSFCIDRWEAFVEVEGGGGWTLHPPNEPLDTVTSPFRAASRAQSLPQAYISGLQASAACAAASKRLCKLTEFRAACGGVKRTLYPYGAERVPGACNDNRSQHPFTDLFGSNSPALFDNVHLNDPRIDLLPATVMPAGSKASCVSTYGVYDLVGNLHEWVEDPKGTFAGGYFEDVELNGHGCEYAATAHSIDYHDYSTGFRCCADPRSPAATDG